MHLEGGCLVRRQPPCLLQPAADHTGGAGLRATTRPVPLQQYSVRHKTLHRIRQIGEPGATAILAIGENLQASVALELEGF
jgi:hypothetical protein